MSQTSPEVRLWKAVIIQAIMDAKNPTVFGIKKHKEKCNQDLISAPALHWLSGKSVDFFEVCLWADVEPKFLRKWVKENL